MVASYIHVYDHQLQTHILLSSLTSLLISSTFMARLRRIELKHWKMNWRELGPSLRFVGVAMGHLKDGH